MKSKLNPGEAFREVRIYLGYNQAEIGYKIGCSQDVIAKIEAGRLRIQDDPANRLVDLLLEKGHLDAEDKGAFKHDLIKGWNATQYLHTEPKPAILLDHANLNYLDQYLNPLKFVGRETEIASIKQAIEDKHKLFIEGFPGIGKTTLVAKMVHDFITNQPTNRVLWLEAGRETDVRLLRAIAKPIDRKNTLGMVPDVELGIFIRRHLPKQKINLVVLEDFWGSNQPDGLADFNVLHAIPLDIPMMITSRNLHHFPGMQRIRLGSLETQAAAELLSSSMEVQSLVSDPIQLKKLCDAVDNHPFAIKLIGGFIRSNPDLEFDWIYEFAQRRLHELVDSDGQRRLDINFLIDQSLKKLNKNAKNIFIACGALHSRRIPLALLNIFLVKQQGLDIDPAKHKALDLVHLRNANLVERTEGEDKQPYIVLHQLALSYARNKANQNVENRLLAMDACEAYIQAQLKDHTALHAARESLFASALDLAARADQTERFIHYIWNFVRPPAYVDGKGYTPASLEALEKAAKKAEDQQMWREAHYMWAKAGNAYSSFLIDYDKAEIAYKKAALLAPKLAGQDEWEPVRREAISESLVGTVYFRQGNTMQADEQFDKAEEITRNDALVLSQIYEHRGHKEVWCYRDYLKAQDYFLKSLEYVDQIKDAGIQIGRRFWSLINLSGVTHDLGDCPQAIGYACGARKIARTLKSYVLLAYALNELGEQYFTLNKMRPARRVFCRAKTLFVNVGDEEWSRKLQLFMEQNDMKCEVKPVTP